ncbi:5-carboxymethyl-2-hydroxymuconate Delta-isomerase [Streptomyces sp. NBC_00083]|uniref:5-carboxymethyl-2-hydroxymuconate Delta-isomerase n=1 Tax=Streptomyces sp. NBC_00083 TaxID=2975647 RepID=UPI002256F2A9|nr:isomerase [Streptomyces sp. NBC_00083]MCX5382804.1 isomerase [Streptomyces sp. NBC_00083]
MPFVIVEYSERLADTFDRRAFAREVHAVAPGLINAPVEAFKSRFRRIEESFFAVTDEDIDAVFIEVAIGSGRTPQAVERLSETVLEIARKHVTGVEGRRLHISVESREMERDFFRSHKE